MPAKSISAIAILCFLGGCTPLPTKFSAIEESPRPIDPLPFEKQPYTIENPTPKLELASPLTSSVRKRTVAVQPSAKLSDEEISTILQQAEDKAVSAENLALSAQSKDDWNLVINQWKRAIDLLKPAISSRKTLIQQKLAQYQRNLANAQSQAKANPSQIAIEEAPPRTSQGIPLIVTPSSPKPTPSASPTPTTSPASPSPSPEPKSQ